MSKQFGLVLKKKAGPGASGSAAKVPSVFADSSDEEEGGPGKAKAKGPALSVSEARAARAGQMSAAKALAEDPSVFDYDAVYDTIVAEREQKKVAAKEADKERKPKYIHNLIKNAKRRELEHEAVEERKQQKEREAEAGAFADKDVFVTGAYRAQMEEVEEHKRELERRDAIDAAQDVTKQAGLAGFYKHLLNDTARVPGAGGGTLQLKEEPQDDPPTSPTSSESQAPRDAFDKASKASRKPRTAYRQRQDSAGSPDRSPGRRSASPPSKQARKDKPSIYSDDEDDPAPRRLEPQTKGGLSLPKARQRVETAQERARRRFTPSPPPEAAAKGQVKGAAQPKPRRRSRTPPTPPSRRRKDEERKGRASPRPRSPSPSPAYDPAKVKREKVQFGVKKVTVKERLEKLRHIFARRNDQKAIEAYRQRYFQRKAEGLCSPA